MAGGVREAGEEWAGGGSSKRWESGNMSENLAMVNISQSKKG